MFTLPSEMLPVRFERFVCRLQRCNSWDCRLWSCCNHWTAIFGLYLVTLWLI